MSAGSTPPSTSPPTPITSFCCGIVALVMMILIMMDVAEKLGFENWWGILLLIPIFNYYVMYKLAFTEPR